VSGSGSPLSTHGRKNKDMEPRVAWWSTLVSVNATVLAIAATFREKFELSQVWTSIALGLLSVSLLLALVMLYARGY